MRIGIVSGVFHPEVGGPPIYLYHLLPMLQQRGHSIEVLTYGENNPEDYGYPVRRISRQMSRPARMLAFTRAVLNLARRSDVLYVLGYIVPLLAIRPLHRGRIVARIVSDSSWEFADRNQLVDLDVVAYQSAALPTRLHLLRTAYHRAARTLDTIIVPSSHVASLVTGWGVPEARVHIIHNAIPETALHTADRAALRRNLGLPEDGHLLTSIARLTPVKGVDVALRALEQLPDCHFVIVGDGPQQAELEAIAPAGRVHFVGRQPHERAMQFMRAADTFVLSSHTEGLSHVLLEALSVGTPAVATRVGGNPEIIESGVNGLLVPPDDPAALATAIQSLQRNPEIAAQIAKAGRERSADFSWTATVDRTEALLIG